MNSPTVSDVLGAFDSFGVKRILRTIIRRQLVQKKNFDPELATAAITSTIELGELVLDGNTGELMRPAL